MKQACPCGCSRVVKGRKPGNAAKLYCVNDNANNHFIGITSFLMERYPNEVEDGFRETLAETNESCAAVRKDLADHMHGTTTSVTRSLDTLYQKVAHYQTFVERYLDGVRSSMPIPPARR